MRGLRVAQYALSALTLALLTYLVAVAFRPELIPTGAFHWFGPGNWATVSISVVVIATLCVVSHRVRRNRSSATVPVVIITGLLAVGAVLAFLSYTTCTVNPARFFTAFEWTTSVMTGGVDVKQLDSGAPCPAGPPASLRVARLAVFAGLSLGIVGVATAALRLQSDRIRAWLSRSVTVVVGADDDALSMVTAIARESARGTLVLMTTTPGDAVSHECRARGARVLLVDFDNPNTLGSKRFWRKLERLYLLAPDPSTNLHRLKVVTDRLAGADMRRIPLIVRIDDPWLAMAWRAEQFGGANTQWAGDAVGKYEVTARRLLDQITAVSTVRQVLVCGSSQLTAALCADMSRRQLERDYHPLDGQPEPPKLVLVDPGARQFLVDHEFQEESAGFGTSHVAIEVVEDVATEAVLSRLIGADQNGAVAIFVDSVTGPTTATRLAARLPKLDVYAWDWQAGVAADAIPIVGRLRNYRLGIDLPDGQAHDNWERAAMLIHERYAAALRSADVETPASVPWTKLDDFYKDSNRRQVANALWMVEHLAGHTWNTWGGGPDGLNPEVLGALPARDQLERLGFTADAVEAMAQHEFEDWSRYYRRNGWRHGTTRDYTAKRHEKLVAGWDETRSDPTLHGAAVRSLAATLVQLRELGYRSQPKWLPYRRVGNVVARRRWRPWTWRTASGETMRAGVGDWDVRDPTTESRWSVRNDIFRSSYRRADGGWRAHGVVLARAAKPGEVIESLEGRETAADGDHIVMGDRGEQWIVPAEKFATRYDGVGVTFIDRLRHVTDKSI